MTRPVLNPLGISKDYTHVKKPYYAYCVQYTDDTEREVINLIATAGGEASPYAGALMVRWFGKQSPSINMFYKGMWLRQGENGVIKLMTDAEFTMKYEAVKQL